MTLFLSLSSFSFSVKGFEYKMRFVYAHFPINVNVTEEGKMVEIRNYIGEKFTRRVPMLDGVSALVSTATKDEIILTGNDLQLVSQSGTSSLTSFIVLPILREKKFSLSPFPFSVSFQFSSCFHPTIYNCS